MAPHSHDSLADAVGPVACAVITVSDTRDTGSDRGGPTVSQKLERAGHPVVYRAIIKDELAAIRGALVAAAGARAVIFTGGTGISARDVTVEALQPLFHKELHGFGELFRHLSFAEIGPAAMLSRAVAGTVGDRIVFALPGSVKAVELAMERLILPELAHMIAMLQ